jgi:hypothetical protein
VPPVTATGEHRLLYVLQARFIQFATLQMRGESTVTSSKPPVHNPGARGLDDVVCLTVLENFIGISIDISDE